MTGVGLLIISALAIISCRFGIIEGTTSASPVYTKQGGTVTLQCPDTDTSIRAQWSVTNSGQFIYYDGTDINPNIPDDTRNRLSVTRQDGTYNLQISDVQLSDVREYRCTIGVKDKNYHLLLYIPPTFPEIQNTVSIDGKNRTTGTEDGSMTLTCNSRGGTPAASVSWIKDGTTLVTSDNAVQHTKVFTRADDMTMYTCQSSSPALTSPQTTSVLVYLYLKPGQPTISDQLSQTENTNLQVVCVSTGSRPAAIIQWNVWGTWQSNNPTEVTVKDSATDTYTVTSTLSLPVTRQDSGKSVYCIASNQALSGGIESVRPSITVLYPPDIHVNYTNTTYTSPARVLTCVPDGKPDTYQFGQWQHTADDGTGIRQLTGISSPLQSVLALPDPGVTRRYEDTGYYVCEASNNIPDSSFYSSGSVFFVVEAPPVVVTNTTVVKGLIGDNVTIEVEFYSRPSVSPSDVTWTRGFNRAPLPDKSVSSVDTKSIQMSFHGVDVKIKGYVAVLKMNTMTEGDFDDYTVTMENSKGKENYTVHMISTGPPTPPLYLLQKQITSNSITVQWIPGSDRGLEQTFVIGYRSDVTADYTYSDAIPDDMEPIITYTLDGLTIKTLYSIRVHAQNVLLQSKEASNEAKNEALYSAVVGLISVSSVLFVLVVALAVFIIINKRKSLPRSETNQAMNKSSSKDDDHHNVDATPSSLSMYEDIHDHEQRTSGQESNNYEVLGGQSLPNVYEDLKRVKDGPDSNYENTAV